MIHMTKQQQTTANMKLLEKLTNYLAENPQKDIHDERESSYVLFSSDNDELNVLNQKLLKTLINEGEVVIKAEETNSKVSPWKFTPVTI